MSWTDGYVTDTNYTYGYYGEMSPQRVDFMLGVAGYEGLPPGPCCELGFGQGLSLAVHAASNPTRTWQRARLFQQDVRRRDHVRSRVGRRHEHIGR